MKTYIIPECTCIRLDENDLIRTSVLNGVSDMAGVGGDMDFSDFFA